MLKVFKYPIPVKDRFIMMLPRGAKILSVDMQGDKPMMWALVDADCEAVVSRNFRFSGTGHPIEEKQEDLDHIGTFQMDNGKFIWHIFEI